MNAGRELDALVAEKVMGWTWNENTAWSPTGSRNARVAHGDLWWWLPPYSTDIAAAWEVVEKLRDRFCIEVRTLPHVGYDVDVSAWDHAVDPRLDSAVMRGSLPHTICLAALAACDQKQEHEPRHD